MLAKMCSDRNKPNGQCRISPERQAVLDFIKDLPIRKVRGTAIHLLYNHLYFWCFKTKISPERKKKF